MHEQLTNKHKQHKQLNNKHFSFFEDEGNSV